MADGQLRVDSEAVAATVRRFAGLSEDLAAMLRHGAGGGVAPAGFGPLGGDVGRVCADRYAAMLSSLERAVEVVDAVAEEVTAADRAVVAADEDAAALITRAGQR